MGHDNIYSSGFHPLCASPNTAGRKTENARLDDVESNPSPTYKRTQVTSSNKGNDKTMETSRMTGYKQYFKYYRGEDEPPSEGDLEFDAWYPMYFKCC